MSATKNKLALVKFIKKRGYGDYKMAYRELYQPIHKLSPERFKSVLGTL